MSEEKTILITGASSGLGQATASLLFQNGYRVFGTSRTPGRTESADYPIIQLDVHSDESVAACIKTVMDRTGRIDVLINNAGFELAGALEETSIEEARAQFETNFFGVARMVKAALPIMRKQRNGQIINISSLAGLIGVPFHGFYSASKYALEGFTETLWHEVDNFNIRISLVEPGFIKTNLGESSLTAVGQIDEYTFMRGQASRHFADSIENGLSSAQVAQKIRAIIRSSSPKLRYRIGKDAKWVPRIKTLMPMTAFGLGLRKKFGLVSFGQIQERSKY